MIKKELDIAYLEYDNNVIYVRVHSDVVLEKSDMELLLKTAVDMAGGEEYYAIIDTTGSGDSTVEARTYYSNSEFSKYRYADAFVVNSLPTKLIVNFYMKFNKPLVKSRMFNNIDCAKAWVNELKTIKVHKGLVSKIL